VKGVKQEFPVRRDERLESGRLHAAEQRPLMPADEPWRVRTWYGLPVEILVEGDYWHKVRVGVISLPHPPLVNLLVRRGLPRAARERLSYWHELGHVQVLPLALAHAVWLWRRRGRREQSRSWAGRVAHLAGAVIAHEVAWELAAEGYVAARTWPEYGQLYRKHPKPFLTFWGIGMAVLALLGLAGSRGAFRKR